MGSRVDKGTLWTKKPTKGSADSATSAVEGDANSQSILPPQQQGLKPPRELKLPQQERRFYHLFRNRHCNPLNSSKIGTLVGKTIRHKYLETL